MTHHQPHHDLEDGRFDLQEMLQEIESEGTAPAQADVKQSDILDMFRKARDEREPKS